MRKVILLTALTTCLIGCQKEWKCTTSGSYLGINFNTPSTFHGSKSDMREYEDKNTTTYATTTCK